MARVEPPVTKSGVIVTEEIAERLADEAEAGYEVDPRQVRPGPGRRSLAGGTGTSPAIQLRLTPDVYRRVVIAAGASGESLSEFVRGAIDVQLQRMDRASRR